MASHFCALTFNFGLRTFDFLVCVWDGECGAISNHARWAHQLLPGMSITGGYYRSWAANFRVTDNLAVTPADHDPYCITAPNDPRLPGGGGYEACGLYDISPAKFGQVNNLSHQFERDSSRHRHERAQGQSPQISAH